MSKFLCGCVSISLGYIPRSKNPLANSGDAGDMGLIPGSERSPGGGHSNPLQHSCLENPYGQRSLVGYSPWGCKELDMTEHARVHGNSVFPLLRTTCLATFYITTSSAWGFQFFPHFYQHLLSDFYSHFGEYKLVSHCGFGLHFPENIFVMQLMLKTSKQNKVFGMAEYIFSLGFSSSII